MEKRKTVNGEDILFAMFSLGFENYSEALKIYLARYREVSGHRSTNMRELVGLTMHRSQTWHAMKPRAVVRVAAAEQLTMQHP